MTSPFPQPCRHRLEPRTRHVFHCRSPKLVGLKVVNPDVCRACPFVDHHFPGTADPCRGVHPGMAAARLATLLEGPPRPWPPGWEDWDVTHQAHRLAADRFLARLRPYPARRFRGRGCVIAGGGPAYFPSLYVTVRALQHVGWTLPIQAWYLGREREMPPAHQSLLERLGVECVDADAVRLRHPCRILNGWELKAFAVLHAPFEEVLSLDADCYPVRDPALLFADPDYRATGAVFWPDFRDGPPLDWTPFGLTPPPDRVSIESGQFLVNKRLCWQPLQLAWWYNDHSDWTYLHGYGDKHTFELAWAKCGRGYTRYCEDVEWSVHSFKHVGPDGGLLFLHRCKDKFRFGSPDYLNPQNFGANQYHPGLPLEAQCFAWLRELERELMPQRPAPRGRLRKTPGVTPHPSLSLRAFVCTLPERRALLEGTLQRWRATDWGTEPTVVVDDGTGPTATVRMLALAAEQAADYSLFLEDDLLFNLHPRHNLLCWPPLRDGWLWMGSLCNPGFSPSGTSGEAELWRQRFMVVDPLAYHGTLAVVLSRAAVTTVLREWDEVQGAFDIRLAALARRHCPGVVMHLPSLVQHLLVPSTWSGGLIRAKDFDPFYRA